MLINEDIERQIMLHNHTVIDYDSIHYTALDPSYQTLASMTRRIQAYDGTLMNRTKWVEDGKLVVEEQTSEDGRPLRKGELASSETHRWMWQKVVDMNLDAALIVEDGAEFVTANRTMADVDMFLKKLVPLLINSGQSHTYDILDLGYNWIPQSDPIISSDGLLAIPHIWYDEDGDRNRRKYQFHVVHAYIVTNRAARQLLAKAHPWVLPVDCYIGKMCGSELNCLQVMPESYINQYAIDHVSDTQGVN
jgi:GR25 family glycosyltransferase involved in LPS biosynthesis